MEAEFPDAGQPFVTTEGSGGLDRRRWMQLMGASFALASAAGCWKEQHLLPFSRRPEDRVPGAFQRFASTMELAGDALGLLVTCVDGRPIKVEGNPAHPSSLGATHAWAQASILEL
ncbi:MAG: molybdopterin oxidoreductase, partial [Planctomycetota bacterium]